MNDINNYKKEEDNESVKTKTNKKEKIFQSFKVKDIVFLAIISVVVIITSAFMPLLLPIPLFGIIQLGLGIQFSLFPVIGLLKTKKIGSLTIISIFIGSFLTIMNPIMGIITILSGLIVELLVLIIFRGYKTDIASIFATTIFMPLSLPALYIFYKFIFSGNKTKLSKATESLTLTKPIVSIGLSIAVIAVTLLGSIIGYLIIKELRKAGKIKC